MNSTSIFVHNRSTSMLYMQSQQLKCKRAALRPYGDGRQRNVAKHFPPFNTLSNFILQFLFFHLFLQLEFNSFMCETLH